MDLPGIHHLTAVSADIRANYRFYTDVMGMRLVKRGVNQDDRSAYYLFYAAAGSPGTDLTFFDTPSEDEYHQGTERLTLFGLAQSGEVDRYYFKSIYVREPNEVMFEIATDGPGFAVDEDVAALGERVALPPFLEPRRAEIVANLKPID